MPVCSWSTSWTTTRSRVSAQRFVSSVLSGAVAEFIKGAKMLGLPLQAKKTVFQVSPGLVESLGAAWAQQGFKRKKTHRNLGVDAAEGRQ